MSTIRQDDERRIVVAEDSLVVRSVVRSLLVERGYVVVEADDGEAALRACRRSRPHAILLDIEMPVLNGHQVLTALKADPDLADIPVVFLTGRTGIDDVVVGLELGAHDYLRKPFEAPELVARVATAVKVKVLQDELRVRNAELERISRTDPLTGLFNRRHLEEHLIRELSVSVRHERPMSVLIFDIDHFKSVNDKYGHASGDAVLREFGARLVAGLRPQDVAGRWGGEEFLAVLPDTAVEGAEVVAERIRSAVADRPVELADGTEVDLTVSVGCAGLVAAAPVEQLIRRADDALYAAKAGGRNQVVRAD